MGRRRGGTMNAREYRILALTIIFSMMALIVIVQAGTSIIDKYYNPRPPPKVEVVKPTPTINVPTPSKGYFVECMHDDIAIVLHHDNIYYHICERGKWKITDDKDNRNYKLPKPQRHDTGTL